MRLFIAALSKPCALLQKAQGLYVFIGFGLIPLVALLPIWTMPGPLVPVHADAGRGLNYLISFFWPIHFLRVARATPIMG